MTKKIKNILILSISTLFVFCLLFLGISFGSSPVKAEELDTSDYVVLKEADLENCFGKPLRFYEDSSLSICPLGLTEPSILIYYDGFEYYNENSEASDLLGGSITCVGYGANYRDYIISEDFLSINFFTTSLEDFDFSSTEVYIIGPGIDAFSNKLFFEGANVSSNLPLVNRYVRLYINDLCPYVFVGENNILDLLNVSKSCNDEYIDFYFPELYGWSEINSFVSLLGNDNESYTISNLYFLAYYDSDTLPDTSKYVEGEAITKRGAVNLNKNEENWIRIYDSSNFMHFKILFFDPVSKSYYHFIVRKVDGFFIYESHPDYIKIPFVDYVGFTDILFYAPFYLDLYGGKYDYMSVDPYWELPSPSDGLHDCYVLIESDSGSPSFPSDDFIENDSVLENDSGFSFGKNFFSIIFSLFLIPCLGLIIYFVVKRIKKSKKR